MNLQFHEYVATILHKEGWHEDRFVDPNYWIRILKDAGFQPTPNVETILSSFGGLKFEPPMNPEGAFRPEELHFDPTDPICNFDLVWYWSRKFGEIFCPIGAACGRAAIVIGESGAYYLVSDVGIHLAGATFVDCMDCLVRAASKPSIVLLAPEE